MAVTLDNLFQWLSAVALLLGIINTVAVWLLRPAKDLAKRLDVVDSDIKGLDGKMVEGQKGHDRRIQRLEDDLRHLPTKDDLHEVVTELTGVKTELGSVQRVVNRIDEHLRSGR